MIERLISLLAPHSCLLCGRDGRILCEWCYPDAFINVPSRCYKCRSVSVDSKTCLKCKKSSALQYVWVASEYADTAKLLIHAYKFERAKSASKIIAGVMSEHLPYLPASTVITYVPTATSRVRKRGYDHARLIALEIARLRGLRCQPILLRRGQSRQVRSTRAERIAHAEDAYSLKNSKSIPRSIVIVDDILTTGATLETAGRLLRKTGCKQVYGAVFAQKT